MIVSVEIRTAGLVLDQPPPHHHSAASQGHPEAEAPCSTTKYRQKSCLIDSLAEAVWVRLLVQVIFHFYMYVKLTCFRWRRHVRHRSSICVQHGRWSGLQGASIWRWTAKTKTERSKWSKRRPAADCTQRIIEFTTSASPFHPSFTFIPIFFGYTLGTIHTFPTRSSKYYAPNIATIQG